MYRLLRLLWPTLILCPVEMLFAQEVPEPAVWEVRLAYHETLPKQKLTASLGAEALLLKDGEQTVLEIPVSQVHSVFYDKALQKQLIRDAIEPRDRAYEAVDKKAYRTAEVAIAAQQIETYAVAGAHVLPQEQGRRVDLAAPAYAHAAFDHIGIGDQLGVFQ